MTKQEKLNKLKQELLYSLRNKEIWFINGKYVIKES
jgi:hypothetical protein